MQDRHPRPLNRQICALCACLIGAILGLADSGAHAQSYVNFESTPSTPLALSPDGSLLFATNTPDNRLEIFEVGPDGLSHRNSVPVGLDPIAVAARSNTEVWVVNSLSDSVSIVSLTPAPARVVRTLHVGDEPGAIVFGGTPGPDGLFPRAFVSAARRGQNHPENPKAELLTPSSERADVWVFDAGALGSGVGGIPEAIVPLFGDTPRALAVSPDGARVYAGVFHSGNGTTTILEPTVCNGGDGAGPCNIGATGGGGGPLQVPGGLPAPNTDADGNPQREVGLIVKNDSATGAWLDELGRDWRNAVPFTLPDLDVFEIDATAATPAVLESFAAVGTVLFDIAVHPSGLVVVSNTDANNAERFEGPGLVGSSLRGHLAESRLTILNPTNGAVSPRHLNKHIFYGPGVTSFAPGTEKGDSLATPTGLAFSADGQTVFVAGFGSSRIGVYPGPGLLDNSFVPDASDDIPISGGGPAGLVIDNTNQFVFVYTRFDNAVKTVDLATSSEIDSHPLHDVEPAEVTDGRFILYDADLSSSNGEAACASCHIFGNMDDLAWDLGDPSGVQGPNPNPFILIGPPNPRFHPLKGPMTTQTLRGMANMGPMHWRGDRTGGTAVPPVSPLDEEAAFEAFNPAFDGLLGRDEGEIPAGDMSDFARFALTIALPPNPHRRLSNQLCTSTDVSDAVAGCVEDEANGEFTYTSVGSDVNGTVACEVCHTLERSNGFFGGDGRSTLEGETQEFKVPHLRNDYAKAGMFGNTSGVLDPGSMGPQIRGYGYLHDGGIASLFDFVSADAFTLTPQQVVDVVAFVFAFDTNYAPVVGQQVTLRSDSDSSVDERIDLFRASAATPFEMVEVMNATQCDLVVKGVIAGEPRGWLFDATTGDYLDDAGSSVADTALRALANTPGQELTFSCVYPLGGTRIGLDRNEDGISDAEQCGDVNGDGLVGAADPALLRLSLSGLRNLIAPSKCNVAGASGGNSSCDAADAAVLIRNQAGLAPGPLQICP